jgi:hypothetical protein
MVPLTAQTHQRFFQTMKSGSLWTGCLFGLSKPTSLQGEASLQPCYSHAVAIPTEPTFASKPSIWCSPPFKTSSPSAKKSFSISPNLHHPRLTHSKVKVGKVFSCLTRNHPFCIFNTYQREFPGGLGNVFFSKFKRLSKIKCGGES